MPEPERLRDLAASLKGKADGLLREADALIAEAEALAGCGKIDPQRVFLSVVHRG